MCIQLGTYSDNANAFKGRLMKYIYGRFVNEIKSIYLSFYNKGAHNQLIYFTLLRFITDEGFVFFLTFKFLNVNRCYFSIRITIETFRWKKMSESPTLLL